MTTPTPRGIGHPLDTATCIDGKNNVVRFAPAPEPEPSTTGALVAEQLKALRARACPCIIHWKKRAKAKKRLQSSGEQF